MSDHDLYIMNYTKIYYEEIIYFFHWEYCILNIRVIGLSIYNVMYESDHHNLIKINRPKLRI